MKRPLRVVNFRIVAEPRSAARRGLRFGLSILALVAAPFVAGPASAVPQQKVMKGIAVAPVVNQWPDEQFERWVFNQYGSADGARRRFDSLLTLQIDDIDRTCHLTDEQKKKLRLIGHGDIKRIFD